MTIAHKKQPPQWVELAEMRAYGFKKVHEFTGAQRFTVLQKQRGNISIKVYISPDRSHVEICVNRMPEVLAHINNMTKLALLHRALFGTPVSQLTIQ